MIHLILSVFFTSLLFIIFKLFEKYNINTLQAITINYFVACICGVLADKKPISLPTIINHSWFYGAVALGIIFILVFNLIAITTQKNGLSVAAVASKMSIVIPITFGIIIYNENTKALKLIGILIALFSVYLTAAKSTGNSIIKKENIIFPVLLFFGNGIIDTSIKYLETNYVATTDIPIFSATIFGIAGIIGTCIILYKTITHSFKLHLKNIVAGILLGVPNYFCIYFLIQALRNDNMDSSTIFTINNVAILLITTLAGILFFKEKLILKNWIGLLLAIISILLVSFSV